MYQDFPSLCTFTKLIKMQLLYTQVDPAKSGSTSLSQLQFTYLLQANYKLVVLWFMAVGLFMIIRTNHPLNKININLKLHQYNLT